MNSLLCLYPDLTELFDEDPNQPYSQDEDGTLHFYVNLKEPPQGFVCPHCGGTHSKPHHYSTRCCQLLPIGGKTTFLHIKQPRRKCLDPNCPACTFIMDIPGFRIFQHRSNQLNGLILALSIFCSAKDAELICKAMGIRISHDSIDRLLYHIMIVDDPNIRKIGVDDVALRKDKTYYTVIYDGETHHLISLLKGRDGKSLKEWLQNHPKIEWIARDRASAYAQAINEVLPECSQVADRFHLIQNLLNRLKDIFQKELPSTFLIQDEQLRDEQEKKEENKEFIREREINKALSTLNYDNTPPIDEDGNIISFISTTGHRHNKQHLHQAEIRQRKYEKICNLQEEWRNQEDKKGFIPILARKYSMSEQSVRKYLNMTDKEIVENVLNITESKKRENKVNNYLNMIFKMLKDEVSPLIVFHYVLSKGYDGSKTALKNRISAIKLNNKIDLE